MAHVHQLHQPLVAVPLWQEAQHLQQEALPLWQEVQSQQQEALPLGAGGAPPVAGGPVLAAGGGPPAGGAPALGGGAPPTAPAPIVGTLAGAPLASLGAPAVPALGGMPPAGAGTPPLVGAPPARPGVPLLVLGAVPGLGAGANPMAQLLMEVMRTLRSKVPLPVFHGKPGEDPITFRKKALNYMEDANIPLAEQTNTFKLCLDGKARQWYDEITVPLLWDDLMVMFCGRFCIYGRTHEE